MKKLIIVTLIAAVTGLLGWGVWVYSRDGELVKQVKMMAKWTEKWNDLNAQERVLEGQKADFTKEWNATCQLLPVPQGQPKLVLDIMQNGQLTCNAPKQPQQAQPQAQQAAPAQAPPAAPVPPTPHK